MPFENYNTSESNVVERVNISLELLLLNDLLLTKGIDKEIYEKAVAKINSIKNQAA